MPGNDEILQLLREMRTNANGKKETVAWLGIAIGILSGFLSFWAGNAVMGERVARLQHDFVEAQKTQTALHARIERVDRDNDKHITALQTLTQAHQIQLAEIQKELRRVVKP
jgi:uncharacterized protein HemX